MRIALYDYPPMQVSRWFVCYTQNFLQKVPHLKNSHEKFIYIERFFRKRGFFEIDLVILDPKA